MTIEFEPNPGAHRADLIRRRLLLRGLAGGASLAMSQNVQAQKRAPNEVPVKAGRDKESERHACLLPVIPAEKPI